MLELLGERLDGSVDAVPDSLERDVGRLLLDWPVARHTPSCLSEDLDESSCGTVADGLSHTGASVARTCFPCGLELGALVVGSSFGELGDLVDVLAEDEAHLSSVFEDVLIPGARVDVEDRDQDAVDSLDMSRGWNNFLCRCNDVGRAARL